ncbi:GNAT family N-acetyltransferase, partial [bacterium]|nr:GNAT family N-acetyltransferase [bacterium]
LYRQQGIGSWLLSNQLNAAKQAGCKNFFLEVRPSNKNAVRLYRKLGFQQEGVRTGYYQKPIEDALLMAKRL